MAVARCSEPGCTNKLVYEDGSPKPAGTKTCSQICRSRRARRLKKAADRKRPGGTTLEEHAEAIRDVVRDGERDALHEAAVDEFRPLVREAMTNEVLRGIDVMIQGQPKAIARLVEDLDHEDPTIRQRAYTLYLKYTMGNQSVAPASTQAQPAGMTVQFNLPRPGDDPAASVSVASDAAELRTCEDCGAEKPEGLFVAGSNRCATCHDGMRKLLQERFGDAYAG